MKNFEVDSENLHIIWYSTIVYVLMYLILHEESYAALITLFIWSIIMIIKPKITKRKKRK